jgi:methionyl-tRNA formyltransferase
VFVEESISPKTILKKRIKKLGWFTVFGQLLFIKLCVPILKNSSKKRIFKLKKQLNLVNTKIENDTLTEVTSVNSKECLEKLKEINPDIIIVNGTRIISKKVLNSLDATIINTHVGITPKYRGVHGGYWAIANNDLDNCGVTVHLIDAGIDTGGILYQTNIEIEKGDNYTTYPLLQIAKGIELMKIAINDVLNDTIKIKNKEVSESRLWYHPTIWFYLKKRIFKGVK